MSSVDDEPVSLAATRSGIEGTAGGVASMVTVLVADVVTFPARSVEVTVNECDPPVSGAVGVKVQAPVLVGLTVPMAIPPSRMVTTVPASVVPENVGVPDAELSVAGDAKARAGAALSTTTFKMGENDEVKGPLTVAFTE